MNICFFIGVINYNLGPNTLTFLNIVEVLTFGKISKLYLFFIPKHVALLDNAVFGYYKEFYLIASSKYSIFYIDLESVKEFVDFYESAYFTSEFSMIFSISLTFSKILIFSWKASLCFIICFSSLVILSLLIFLKLSRHSWSVLMIIGSVISNAFDEAGIIKGEFETLYDLISICPS